MAARYDSGVFLLGGLLGLGAVAVGLLAGADPALAIAGSLAIAFVLIVFANLAAGLSLFVLVSFVEVLPIGGTLSATKLAGLVLALAWLAAITVGPHARGRAIDIVSAQPMLVGLLVLFLGWTAISAVWAQEPPVAYETTYRYALNFILFAIVFTAVASERRAATWIYWAFVTGAVISCLYGLAVGAGSEAFNEVGEPTRLTGAGIDPNGLATVLVGGMTLALGLAVVSRRAPLLRLLALGAAGLCALGVMLTLSRAGLLALGAVIIAGVVVASRKRGRLLVVACLGLTAIVAYFAVIAGPEARERVTEVGSGSGRTDIWTVGWRMFEDNAVSGVGAGNFSVTSLEYAFEPGAIDAGTLRSDQGEGKVAHNVYLETLAELGIVGLGLLLAIFVYSVTAAARAASNFARNGDERRETLARALMAAQIGTIVAGFFASIQITKQLWLLMALGPALLALSLQAVDGQRAERERPSGG
jgi:O-antigen ligase